MEFNRFIFISVYIAIALYFLYKVFFKKNLGNDYERIYNEILNSDKYKVKGQWSDREK